MQIMLTISFKGFINPTPSFYATSYTSIHTIILQINKPYNNNDDTLKGASIC